MTAIEEAQGEAGASDITRGTTRISGSLSCGARDVRSPCTWRGGARPDSRVTGGSLELSPSVESCGCGLGPSPVRLGC